MILSIAWSIVAGTILAAIILGVIDMFKSEHLDITIKKVYMLLIISIVVVGIFIV